MKTGQLNGSRLRKPIIYSSIIHLVVFITLAAIPGLYIPLGDRPLKIDVMLVELPKGTSEEIDLGIKKADNLPQSTIEEQKKYFQPEPPQQKSLNPEMKSPPEKTPEETSQEKVKNESRPKIETPKMVKEDAKLKPAPRLSKTDKAIKNALASIDKQLAGRQIVPEASQVDQAGQGFKYGTGNKALRVSPSDPEYIKYQAMVRAKVIRAWIVPTVYAEEGGGRYNARVEVMINMDGDVTSTRWQKTSGNASFDQSALRAVKNASPFPKPPDRLAWEAYNEGFLIEFDPRLKPQ